MAITANLKALGLNTDPNLLSVPEGSLVEASNVVIRKNDIVESRRGYKLYGEAIGTSTDRVTQLSEYRNRILAYYSDKLLFDDGSGDFSQFSGSFSPTETGLRIKSVVANGNYYFTTSDGIKKISATSSSQFSTSSDYIINAGGIKAIDLAAAINYQYKSTTGFLVQDSAVAYRVVWGYKDANENLILGSPSPRAEVYNPMLPLVIRDFMQALSALDSIAATSMINDGNYVDTLKLEIDADAIAVRSQIIALANKLDIDILYADTTGSQPLTLSTAEVTSNIATVTFSAGDASQYFQIGSKIEIRAFTPVADVLNGFREITTVSPTTITFNITTANFGPTVLTPTSNIVSNEYRDLVTNPTWPIPVTPTPHDDLAEIQNRFLNILTRLQTEPITVIPLVTSNAYIQTLGVTTSTTVILNITIPQGITANYFYQIYRSSLVTATGTTVLSDLTPSDELQLVYEAFPTSTELTAGQIIVEDITPDAFRGANLYTNASTGEGITQANDSPPFAKDINRFRNVIFYANTKTKQRKSMSLLGVSKLIEDYNNSIIPKLVISNGIITNVYTFVTGKPEITDLTLTAEASFTGTTRRYFDLYSANDITPYRVIYESPTMVTDPVFSGFSPIRVSLAGGETASQVATKTRDAIAIYVADFITEDNTLPTIRITNANEGPSTNLSSGTMPAGTIISVFQQGQGEDASANQVLLSTNISPSIAVDNTARSLVRVINRTSNTTVYAYYLSGANDVPGKFLLEEISLNGPAFYLLANDENTGSSFNPDISPLTTPTITAISVASPTQLTITGHGLVNGDQIVIVGSNSTPSIDGLHSITRVDANNVTIPVNVTVSGSGLASYQKADDAEVSDNEVKINRIYYSKFQQPEAVPIVNYFDVGASDKAILRIFPLRDSLFVFKEDGLYRISGNSAPFDLALFDGSCNLIAPDTVDVTENQIYCWTNQGITKVNESGADVVSRPINTKILNLAISTNFKTASWGIGYQSDNSYAVFTTAELDDEVATVAYRYSTLTNTWTTYDKSDTCGIIFSVDDKEYFGAGDTNFIEQERKSFSRYDYADRELPFTIIANAYVNNKIKLPVVTQVDIGDVVVQEQLLTIYEYNQLLKKLDTDPGINDSDYYSLLFAINGDSLRTKIQLLAQKLDADSGPAFSNYFSRIATKSGSIVSNSIANPTIVTTTAPHSLETGRYIQITGVTGSNADINDLFVVTVLSPTTFSIPANVISPGTGGSFVTNDQSFTDIAACYNLIIQNLNNDANVTFSNYLLLDTTTSQESIIIAVDRNTKNITINKTLQYVVGPITIFKAISSAVQYAPQTMGDPITFKHFREAQLFFADKTFTSAVMSFSTDLLPEFIPVPFNSDGNGIFGHNNFGFGFFGGMGNSAPFRTYVPRQCQRCRYLNIRFEHVVAREQWELYGGSLVGDVFSSRAYK